MIWPFIRRAARSDTISTLYGTIVTQARLPCFYSDYAVADTVNGRFDLIVVHLALVFDRLYSEPALHPLGQGLFDRFCRDMDDNLREMGVGDLSVPKEMRTIGDAFFGRSKAYQAALKSSEKTELDLVVARNVYGKSPARPAAARQLAAYMRQTHHDLSQQAAASLSRGEVRFPDPAGFLAVVGTPIKGAT